MHNSVSADHAPSLSGTPRRRRSRRHQPSTTTAPAHPPHLTVQQLADRWQVHPDFLRRAVLGQPAPDGIPEAYTIGSGPKARWRIPLHAVEAYEHRHRPLSPTA